MAENIRSTLNKLLKNPDFQKEWDALEPEYQIIRALIQTRTEKDMTQKELSKKTGIAQADISKLENGCANPSVRTLKRLAQALGKRLVIEFR